MASQYAIQDPNGNQNYGLLGHSGTANTAETVRIVTTPAGQMSVNAGGTYGQFTQDALSGAIVSVPFEHHELHDGSFFFLEGFATVGTAANNDFIVTTPNTTTWAHMRFALEATDQTEFYVYEGNILGTGGTAVTPVNSNRNSSGTSVLTIKQNQVVGTLGTKLASQSFGASSNPAKSIGGGLGREDEIILKQNTNYLFRITSRADGNIVSYRGMWYEHISSN